MRVRVRVEGVGYHSTTTRYQVLRYYHFGHPSPPTRPAHVPQLEEDVRPVGSAAPCVVQEGEGEKGDGTCPHQGSALPRAGQNRTLEDATGRGPGAFRQDAAAGEIVH